MYRLYYFIVVAKIKPDQVSKFTSLETNSKNEECWVKVQLLHSFNLDEDAFGIQLTLINTINSACATENLCLEAFI